jgi:trigger factor
VKVTSQTLENRQVALSIEVEDERIQQALRHTARHIANTSRIPGFRKGKAPYNVVVRAVGEETVYQEMLEELGPQLYKEALSESQLEPYAVGHLDEIQKSPFVLKFIVPLRPTIELGDYRSLRVPYTAPQVADEQVDEVLKGLQERNAIMEPAGEGPVELNQVATVTLDAKLDPALDETLFHEQDVPMLVAETTDFPFPGYALNLIGMKVGEEKTIPLIVPENYDDEMLRGKTVYLQTKLNDLKVRRVPPLDDALAQTIGEYETLDALRQAVRTSLEQQALRQADTRYANTCADKLAQQAQVEFPPEMVEAELDGIVERAKERSSEQKMSWEEFLNIKKQTEEQYRDEMRPQASNNVRRALALGRLAELEKLQVNDDEVSAALQSIVDSYPENNAQVSEALSSNEFKRSVRLDLFSSKIMGRLVSVCKGENPPLPAAEEPELVTEPTVPTTEEPTQTTELAQPEPPVESN